MTGNEAPERKKAYEFGPFRVDPEKEILFRENQPVPLTPKTFQILLVLVRHSQQVVTKDDLMKAVWPDTFVEEANLSRNIFMLRKALGETSQQHRYIITVPGRGYRLAESVRLVPEQEMNVAAASQARMQVQVTDETAWRRIALAAVSAIAAGVIVFGLLRHPTRGLTEKDTVVLADFSNSTGDPVFDGTLRQGMAVQLEQSPFLSLVSDARLQRTLTLMGRPAEVRLTPDTAREVCVRIGAAAVLEGSVASVGSQYVLGLSAKDCRTGEVLDEQQIQATRKEDVLTALSEVARNFRTRIGESLATVEKHSTRLDEATTTSLEALKAYSLGWQVHAARGASASMPLFQRAAEIDPGFAMAHASLGRMYADLDQSDLAAASIRRAWELRERLSDPERFFLTALYQTLVTGNMEAAQQTGEAWARAYPREPRAHMMLAGMVHKVPGRFEKALAEARRAIEIDPDFAISYYSSGVNSLYLGRVGDAEGALRAAAARNLDIDEFIMLGYDIAFVTQDQTRLEGEAARARARSAGENWMSAREAFVAAYSGHLQAARSMSQRAVLQAQQAGQPERASLWEAGAAVREALFGNRAAASERALDAMRLSHAREVEYGAALALALCGDSSRAQTLADDLQRRFPDDSSVRFSYLPSIRAVLALNRREPESALALLQVALPHEFGVPPSSISGLFGALYPVYVRGQAYLAAHRGPEAAAEFQKILDHPTTVISDPIGALSHLQLGRAYAVRGDSTNAAAAYRDFLALWKDADSDIPVLRQADAEYAKLQ
jgi:DNA-binding winged helix-turn-helix (wHTH) protein/tetratricopeptide (TPR) repeat protein